MDLPTYRPAKQGGHILLYKSFEYTKHKSDGKRVYYRCRERTKSSCPVSLALDKDNGAVVRTTNEHNHDSQLLEKKVRDAEQEAIKNAASHPTVAPRTVFGLFANKVQQEVPGGINLTRSSASFKKAVQRERKKVLGAPLNPKTWSDLKVPDDFSKTMDGKNFLILERKWTKFLTRRYLTSRHYSVYD